MSVLSSLPISSELRLHFGPHAISAAQCFFVSALSYATVNISPVVPGHVLICPRRSVQRVNALSRDELTDIMTVAQRIGPVLEKRFDASALTFAIQDGKDAGQTIPHVHLHLIPRRPNDFEHNDDIYTRIEDHRDRQARRTPDEMNFEAAELRALLDVE